MATRITGFEISSDVTRHTARFNDHAAADGNGAWIVSWMPARLLTQSQALHAMTIAETVHANADERPDSMSPCWADVAQWAEALVMTRLTAIRQASLSP